MLTKKNVIILLAILLVVDQVVKIIIKTNMTIGESIPVFGSWFQILFIENEGAAFGMKLGGRGGKLALSLFRIAAIGGLVWLLGYMRRKEAPRGVMIGFTLILAGAAGNMIDSAFYGLIFSESTYMTVATAFPEGGGYAPLLFGKVVDMLYFPIIDTVWPDWMPLVGGRRFIFFSPVFNIADTYITIGVLWLLIWHRKFFTENIA
jgi:signal peptidase II